MLGKTNRAVGPRPHRLATPRRGRSP